MFLDPIISAIRAPFDLVRGKIFGVQSIKGGIKGDVGRLKQLPKEMAGYAKDTAGQAKALGAEGKAAAQKANAARKAKKDAPKKPKKKWSMGLFGKKKSCESCGQKLHPSWDQCPYCGAGGEQAAAPVAEAAPVQTGPAQKMKTMSMDTGGQAGPSGSNIGWLVPLEGPQAGELYSLKGRAIVGSAQGCDVVLNDSSISGRHAEFVASGRNGFRVSDLGSTNGTFVNDKRVTNSDLIDNDNVRLGRTNFKFKSMN